MPCLFLSNVASNYLNNKIVSKGLKILILLGLICSVGYIKNGYPFYIGQTSQALPYVLSGILLGGGNPLEINKIGNIKGVTVIISLITLLIVYVSGVTCNMQSCSFSPCYPVSFMVGLLGFFSIYVIAYCLQKNFVLSWVGMNSLAIMLMHEPVKRIVIQLYAICLNKSVDVVRESLLNSLAITILTILILVPIVLLINKYCPILLGKSPHRK